MKYSMLVFNQLKSWTLIRSSVIVYNKPSINSLPSVCVLTEVYENGWKIMTKHTLIIAILHIYWLFILTNRLPLTKLRNSPQVHAKQSKTVWLRKVGKTRNGVAPIWFVSTPDWKIPNKLIKVSLLLRVYSHVRTCWAFLLPVLQEHPMIFLFLTEIQPERPE